MDVKSTLASSGLGSIQKAMLIIHKQSKSVAAASKSVTDRAKNALSLSSSLSGVSSLSASEDCVMQVQYNPSSLSIQANAESIPFTYLQQNVDSGIPNQSYRPPMVVLSVQLIFDAMNPKDAFMSEKYSVSTGGLVSSVAGTVKSALGETYTVQSQTDGLIAALLTPDTRMVTFCWADMAFTGHLIEVEAQYTMFSVSGKPIRSTVQMNIAQQMSSESDIQYWDDALDKAIADHTLDKGKSLDQTLGNLLNLDAF